MAGGFIIQLASISLATTCRRLSSLLRLTNQVYMHTLHNLLLGVEPLSSKSAGEKPDKFVHIPYILRMCDSWELCPHKSVGKLKFF